MKYSDYGVGCDICTHPMRWLIILLTVSGCAYPRVSEQELDRRMAEVDKLIEYCQNTAEIGHPKIDVEDAQFTACITDTLNRH